MKFQHKQLKFDKQASKRKIGIGEKKSAV